MPDTTPSDSSGPAGTRNVPDLPLILDQLQNQLDDLRAAVAAQQTQLDQIADRLAALEHR